MKGEFKESYSKSNGRTVFVYYLQGTDSEITVYKKSVGNYYREENNKPLNPTEWTKLARCSYDEPSDPYIEVILEQNLKGERCAIQRYQEIADFTAGKDHSTHQMAVQILNEELQHENDIEDWINDIARMKEEWKKIRM